MKFKFFSILFFIVISAFSVNATEKKVTLANLEFPPYAGKNLKNGGFLSEITTEAFQRKGYTVVYKYVPWARTLKGGKPGIYDGACVAWYRPEREEWFIFSKPMPASEVVFFKRKGVKINFKGKYETLTPYNIGVVRGYVNPPGFDAIKSRLKVEEVTSDILNIRKLIKGRIDLILIDRYMAQYNLSTKMPGYIDAIEAMEPTLTKEPNHIIFSKAAKNIQEKIDAFNAGLTEMEKEGKVEEILIKHGF
ncbi:transporter substrate-binding domain-containing protein [Desulfobacterales bacterium HSG16]|nr:transporter substrate-binding domain-containing protein [Desulfobacterales bacterium HSG16]